MRTKFLCSVIPASVNRKKTTYRVFLATTNPCNKIKHQVFHTENYSRLYFFLIHHEAKGRQSFSQARAIQNVWVSISVVPTYCQKLYFELWLLVDFVQYDVSDATTMLFSRNVRKRNSPYHKIVTTIRNAFTITFQPLKLIAFFGQCY